MGGGGGMGGDAGGGMSAETGGTGGSRGGGARGGGSRGGGGGGGEMPSGPPPITLRLVWTSAIPVKQATVRAQLGAEAATSEKAKAYLERKEEFYSIALIGPQSLGMMLARGGGEGGRPPGGGGARPQDGGGRPPEGAAAPSADERKAMIEKRISDLKEKTHIARKGHEDLHPASIEMQQPGVFLFRFPRTDAIILDDKEVEFATKFGTIDIKRKFRLKEMVYNGELAL
jgi:hypothetical protein